MTDAQLWSLVVGALAPNAIAILNQPRFSPGLRTLVMVLVCAIGAFITSYLEDEFNGRSLISSTLITIVSAVTFYREVWSRFGVTQAIEAATSGKGEKSLAYRAPYAENHGHGRAPTGGLTNAEADTDVTVTGTGTHGATAPGYVDVDPDDPTARRGFGGSSTR